MSNEIAIRSELVELYSITNDVYDALSQDLTTNIDKEKTSISSKPKIGSKNIEDFESGIYSLNKCMSLYKAQRNLYYYYSHAKELQGDYLDNLMFGLKLNKALDINNEDSNFEAVKLNLIKALLASIKALSKELRTDSMIEFATSNIGLVEEAVSKKHESPEVNTGLYGKSFSNHENPIFISPGSLDSSLSQENFQPDLFRNNDKNYYAESNPELATLNVNSFQTGNNNGVTRVNRLRQSSQVASPQSLQGEAFQERSVLMGPKKENISAPVRSHKIFSAGSQIPPNIFATEVQITSHTIVGDGINSHVEFTIVAAKFTGGHLTVHRRYSAFANLRYVLCQRHPIFKSTIPVLPPKRVIGNFDEKFLQARKRVLQGFISYVALHPILGSSIYLKNWFIRPQ